MTTLDPWEVNVIRALALEAYRRESETTAIVNRDRWLDAAEGARQQRAVEEVLFRRSLYANAQRLGIHAPPKPRPGGRFEPDHHDTASAEHATRWQRVINLVRTLPTTHPWRAVHRELITHPMMDARAAGEAWEPASQESYEILHLLERAHTELATEAPREAPAVDGLAQTLARARQTGAPA